MYNYEQYVLFIRDATDVAIFYVQLIYIYVNMIFFSEDVTYMY